MSEIIPFRGIRYKSADLSRLICPPYDIISEEERKRLLSLSKNNFVRIESPQKIGVSEKADKRAAAGSAKIFKSWLKTGVLMHEKNPAYYVYSQEFEVYGRKLRRTGFFVALRLEEKDIFNHENISQKPISGRLELMRRTGGANISPIFCLFPDRGKIISSALKKISGHKYDSAFRAQFQDKDKILHRITAVDDVRLINLLTGALKKTGVLIADGHHRYHAALIYRKEMRAAKKSPGPYDYILAYLCAIEDPGVIIMPTHRVVRSTPLIRSAIEKMFKLMPWSGNKKPRMIVYHNGSFFDMKFRNKSQIPSMLLSKTVLKDVSPDDIIYTHDHAEAVKAAQQVNGYAFLLEPPSIKTVYDFSLKGKIMPPKTTYFYPKVPAGLVIYG